MSVTAKDANDILKDLTKAKVEARLLQSTLGQVDRDATRVFSTIQQLSRGNLSGLLSQLTALTPYGPFLNLAILFGVQIGAEIYRRLTEEKPTEMFYWRYPP